MNTEGCLPREKFLFGFLPVFLGKSVVLFREEKSKKLGTVCNVCLREPTRYVSTGFQKISPFLLRRRWKKLEKKHFFHWKKR